MPAQLEHGALMKLSKMGAAPLEAVPAPPPLKRLTKGTKVPLESLEKLVEERPSAKLKLPRTPRDAGDPAWDGLRATVESILAAEGISPLPEHEVFYNALIEASKTNQLFVEVLNAVGLTAGYAAQLSRVDPFFAYLLELIRQRTGARLMKEALEGKCQQRIAALILSAVHGISEKKIFEQPAPLANETVRLGAPGETWEDA